MAALPAPYTLRVLALATVVLSLSVVSETRLLRGRRSEWDGQSFVALRARAYDLFNRKEYAAAADLWQKGYKQAVAHHDTLSALRFLNNIGTVHFGLLQYRQAIDAFVEAQNLARSNSDRVTFSVTCANLCSLYMQVGDMPAATASAEQGLRIPADPNLPYRSTFLVTLGLLSSHSGHGTKALQYFREAVSEAEAHGPDALRLEAWNYYAQGLLRAGDLPGAEIAALNAFHLGRLKTVRDLRPAYWTLARIHRARGDTRTALALINRGLAIPPRSGDHQLWNLYFLYERARLRVAEGHPAAAVPDLRLALSYARDWREAIDAPIDTLRSAAECSTAEFCLKDVYDTYIDAATNTNSPAEAFLAVEEERSASLVQMLAEGTSSQEPGTGSRWPVTYWEDLARLHAVEIARISNPAAYDKKGAAQIRQRLSEAEVRAGANFFVKPVEKGENILSPNTLHGVQRNISPEEAILSLHSGASCSFLWAVTSSHLEMHRLAPPDRLTGMAERFRRAVEESAPERDRLGRQLYLELFGSLSAPVLAKRSWVVTSDDSLFEIPFEALVVEDGGPDRSRPVYLVERHETHRIPSAFMLTRAPAPIARGPFLAVGDGIYNVADERWTAARSARKLAGFSSLFAPARTNLPLELPRLVSSTYELMSSAATWNSQTRPLLLTGSNASRERLLPALREKPAVIHIAAHVLYPKGNPGEALIDLGLSPNGTPEVLTTEDLTRLRVDGALVVLSGCSSAAANAVRGAGIMGLTRAWLLAGARAVVGSRWSVQDDTGDLFRSFYAHLASSEGGNRRIGSALRQAQLQMLRSHTWRSDPRYWGAFYLLTKE